MCPHPLSCCMYTALIPCLAAYILPSSPVLLHIYCTCFSTFWHCHPYILMEMFLLSCITGFLYRNSRMTYLLCVYKAYNSRSSALLALWACRRNPYIYSGYIRELSTGYIRESSRIILTIIISDLNHSLHWVQCDSHIQTRSPLQSDIK